MPYKSDKIKLPAKYDRRRKLSEETKEEIRTLYKQGNISHRQLALKYNVSKSCITLIVSPDRQEKVKEYVKTKLEKSLQPRVSDKSYQKHKKL